MLVEVEYDLTDYKEGLRDIPNRLDHAAWMYNGAIWFDIQHTLMDRKYIKGVHLSSDLNWNDRILLDKVNDEDANYEDDNNEQVQYGP